MKHSLATTIALAGAALGVMASSALAQTTKVLFIEDFESLTLGPNVEEGILTGAGGAQSAVWTPSLPAGWDRTFSQTGIGVLEWQGWHAALGSWWQFTCGDQNRSDFTTDPGHLSYGAALIADPDEWDDFDANGLNPDGDGRRFNAAATTPAFSMAGAAQNTAVLRFYSSWRDEGNQTALVSISYDGGAFQQILEFSSDPNSPNYKPFATNEVVEIPLNNPGGVSNARVKFELNDAVNNWWWAVDTIVVFADTTAAQTNTPAAFFASIPTFNTTTAVPVTYPVVEGADSYVLEFSKTEDFSTIVTSVPTASAPAVVPAGTLQPGIYWGRVAAVNSFGTRVSENSVRFVVDRPCLGDFNDDGTTDFFDIIAFLSQFSAPCP